MSDAIATTKPAAGAWVQNWVKQVRGDIAQAPAASPVSYVKETGSTVGEYTEGGVVGSLLGATHAKWGLDSPAGPVDGLIAGLGFLASVGLSGHYPGAAAHFRKIGAQAFTILAFRKGYEVVKHEPLMGGTSNGVQRMAAPGRGPGAQGEDPIELAAKGLDT